MKKNFGAQIAAAARYFIRHSAGQNIAAGIAGILGVGGKSAFAHLNVRPIITIAVEVAWVLVLWYTLSDTAMVLAVWLFSFLMCGVVAGLGNAFTVFLKADRFGEYRGLVGVLLGLAAIMFFIVVIFARP